MDRNPYEPPRAKTGPPKAPRGGGSSAWVEVVVVLAILVSIPVTCVLIVALMARYYGELTPAKITHAQDQTPEVRQAALHR